jgi:hypothetical protein
MGDFVQLDEGLYVVLTPSCDLVPRDEGVAKASELLVASCLPLEQFALGEKDLRSALKQLRSGKGTSKRNNGVNKISKLFRQAWLNDDGRHFFLPPFATFSGGVVDFLSVKVLPNGKKDRKDLLDRRVFSLNMDFGSEVGSRFGRFMSRLGQASFDPEPLISSVSKQFEAVDL